MKCLTRSRRERERERERDSSIYTVDDTLLLLYGKKRVVVLKGRGRGKSVSQSVSHNVVTSS